MTSYESGQQVSWGAGSGVYLDPQERLTASQKAETPTSACSSDQSWTSDPRCSLLFYNRATPRTRRHLHPCRGEERSSSLTAHPREDSGKGAKKGGKLTTHSTNIYLISTLEKHVSSRQTCTWWVGSAFSSFWGRRLPRT